ncbi:prominin-2-like [Clupea harengus]|uniref:Prominin-2-like n=1 Tax=Clupea harengus TaxID=7950 RepID=A0A8M1KC15_CLUHA|nr:prominin-2-like [Clupea harengus]
MVHLGGAVVLLLLSLISSTEPMEKCPENADLSFLENLTPAPGKSIDMSVGSLEPLYNFARLFIEAVQPNNFPLELAINASRNVPLNISLLVEYEAGYLVCLILAILYVLIMPVVGGVLAWNHLHLKKRSPNKTSTASSICPHMVIILETCLAVVVILLLTGVILAFTTNNKVRENMKPSLEQLSTDIKKVDDILKLIPKNTRAVINGFSIPKREITKELNETGNVIGETLISSFDRSVREALSALALSVQDASGALTNLEKMEMKRKDLQARHRVIQLRLQAIQSELQRIQTGCPDCNVSDASNLETVADFHQIPSVQPQLDQLNGFSSILATNIVREGNLSFYSIPQICSNQLEPTITELVLDLEDSEEYLRNSSGRIPTLRSLSNSVSSLRLAVQQYRRDVDYYDYVRWAVAVVFCMLILVIVILMVVALCLGLPIEYFPSLYSSLTKDRFKHTAVYLLRSAVVMTFFFSWLFLILVFITLLIGGNAHTLGCRSWKSGALFELLDQWEDLFLVGPGYNTTYGINSTHTTNFSQELNSTQNIKVKFQAAEVYHGCMRGESLFYSMHMHEVLNMDAFLNASKYLGVFNQSFQTLSVNLDGVTLLQPDGRQALLKFKSSTLNLIKYTALLDLLSQPVVGTDLTAFAEGLDKAAQLQGNETVKEDLKKVANMTRNLTQLVELQELDAREMSTSVRSMREISQKYQGNADRALNSITETEEAIHLQTPYIVRNVSQCVLKKGERYISEYLDWVRNAVINMVLDCKWLPVSVDNIYTAACLNIIDPWNAFWLCLGWCWALLIPGVILSIHTARHWWQAVPKSLSVTLKDLDSSPGMTKSYKSLK